MEELALDQAKSELNDGKILLRHPRLDRLLHEERMYETSQKKLSQEPTTTCQIKRSS